MTNDEFFIGGADRREPLLLRSSAPEFQLTGLWRGAERIAAYSPVIPEEPFFPVSGPQEVPEPIFTLRAPGALDRDNWGILIDPLEEGYCGRVVMAGIVAARISFSSARPHGFAAPGPDGSLHDVHDGRARILSFAAGVDSSYPGAAARNELSLLLLAPPGAGAAYAGYFMLALHCAGVSDYRVRVVDGATYDGSALSSSADSVCKVNNRAFGVAPWESERITGSRIVALRFTPGETWATDSVEPVLLESLPDDGENAVYCQLGRVEVPNGDQNLMRVIQDHTSGVAQLWWFFQCR